MYYGKDRRKQMDPELQNALQAVHPTWMWSAADAREGIAEPITDEFAQALLSQRPDHEISKVVRLGLFAGFRLHDAVSFEIKQIHGIFCLHLRERVGYYEGYIPVHQALTDFDRARGRPSALGTFYRRLEPFKNNPTDQKILFGSLHMTFRAKLAALGLDPEIINGLSGWNLRMVWNAETLELARKAIRKISFI